MKQFISTIAIAIFFSTFSFASTIYVRSGQTGNGTSWADATGDLQAALNQAADGTEIWVARGTYFPTNCKNCTSKDRAKSFNVREGVQLFGGFIGNETSKDARDAKLNPTVLSGSIGHDDLFDNSFTVVYFENVSNKTILDGFTITGGMSDAPQADNATAGRTGAGIYNICTTPNGTSNPTINNCLLFENMASEGGAIFNYSKNGTAIVTAENTNFVKNKAVNTGGAILDAGSKTVSTFTNCKFVNNTAKKGSAYYSATPNSEENIFDSCKFINNEAEFGTQNVVSNDNADNYAKTVAAKNINTKPAKTTSL